MTALINRGQELYALVYHYINSEERARSIAQSGLMFPSLPELSNFVEDECLARPRVNFTDVMPEEGREIISANTSLALENINYCLELLVDSKRLVQRIDFEPRCYQIYTSKPVKVIALRWWNMDKVKRWIKTGHKIERAFVNGIPYARWAKC